MILVLEFLISSSSDIRLAKVFIASSSSVFLCSSRLRYLSFSFRSSLRGGFCVNVMMIVKSERMHATAKSHHFAVPLIKVANVYSSPDVRVRTVVAESQRRERNPPAQERNFSSELRGFFCGVVMN